MGTWQFSIREIRKEIPARRTSAYTTVYRMEAKGLVRRVKKVGNFHVFEAVTSAATEGRGRAQRLPRSPRPERAESFLTCGSTAFRSAC